MRTTPSPRYKTGTWGHPAFGQFGTNLPTNQPERGSREWKRCDEAESLLRPNQLSVGRAGFAVMFEVRLGRFLSVVRGVKVVRLSHVRVMRRHFVVTGFMVLRGFLVMMSRVFVMLCCLVVMLCRLF